MISLDRRWMPLWSLRFAVVMLAFPVGCAKSQPPAEELQQPILKEEAVIWTANEGLETTRTQFAEFELVEVEREPQDELVGHCEGTAVVVIPRSEGLCLEIIDQQDFDGDGHVDLLLGENGACHGNCCRNQYFIVSYRGQGKYLRSLPQGHAMHAPVLQQTKGGWSVLIEDAELDEFENHAAVARFSITEGQLKLVAVEQAPLMPAQPEIVVAAFDSLSQDSLLQLRFDLDGDGAVDVVSGIFWPQWQRVRWSLTFGNGKVMEGGPPFKRLGVLPSKTDGFHDLVVDRDRILVWKGKRYEELED